MAETDEYYRKKVEDYQNYDDYRRDQDQFHARLRTDKKVLFNALSNHRLDTAAELLGIPPEIHNTLRAPFGTAEWSLTHEINELVKLIDDSALIDDAAKMHWMTELEQTPEMDTSEASQQLAAFGSTLIAWKTRFKAERRMLELALSSEMNLERDISTIARKTLAILEIINHRSIEKEA